MLYAAIAMVVVTADVSAIQVESSPLKAQEWRLPAHGGGALENCAVLVRQTPNRNAKDRSAFQLLCLSRAQGSTVILMTDEGLPYAVCTGDAVTVLPFDRPEVLLRFPGARFGFRLDATTVFSPDFGISDKKESKKERGLFEIDFSGAFRELGKFSLNRHTDRLNSRVVLKNPNGGWARIDLARDPRAFPCEFLAFGGGDGSTVEVAVLEPPRELASLKEWRSPSDFDTVGLDVSASGLVVEEQDSEVAALVSELFAGFIPEHGRNNEQWRRQSERWRVMLWRQLFVGIFDSDTKFVVRFERMLGVLESAQPTVNVRSELAKAVSVMTQLAIQGEYHRVASASVMSSNSYNRCVFRRRCELYLSKRLMQRLCDSLIKISWNRDLPRELRVQAVILASDLGAWSDSSVDGGQFGKDVPDEDIKIPLSYTHVMHRVATEKDKTCLLDTVVNSNISSQLLLLAIEAIATIQENSVPNDVIVDVLAKHDAQSQHEVYRTLIALANTSVGRGALLEVLERQEVGDKFIDPIMILSRKRSEEPPAYFVRLCSAMQAIALNPKLSTVVRSKAANVGIAAGNSPMFFESLSRQAFAERNPKLLGNIAAFVATGISESEIIDLVLKHEEFLESPDLSLKLAYNAIGVALAGKRALSSNGVSAINRIAVRDLKDPNPQIRCNGCELILSMHGVGNSVHITALEAVRLTLLAEQDIPCFAVQSSLLFSITQQAIPGGLTLVTPADVVLDDATSERWRAHSEGIRVAAKALNLNRSFRAKKLSP